MNVKGTPGQKRHYLSAASIGYFSANSSPETLRQRAVWVLRKDSDKPRLDKAENVGYGKRIFGYGKDFPFDHDGYFKNAEVMVHDPVERIMAGQMPWANADDWAKVAWYITIQIVRNPDVEREMMATLPKRGWDRARISMGYPLNAQRVSSAILRARWEFVWSPDADLVLGDRGITGMAHPFAKKPGYFVPLRKNFGVLLGPAPYEKPMKWDIDQWRIKIPAYTIPAEVAHKLNLVMWHAARDEIYGQSAEQLLKIRDEAATVPEKTCAIAPMYEAAQLIGLSPRQRMDDEMQLRGLLAGIKNPEDENDPPLIKV